MTPARVGPYELLETLGEGGMGRVYRARDTRLGRIVALKFIRTQPGDRSRQLRFLREAKAEAALNHPNIATILDIGEAELDHPEISPRPEGAEPPGPVPFLVLEYVPGEDLAQIAHHGPLAAGELLRIARQIAAGLRSAHAAGVIHRDLKPANVRVTPEGLVKILDFGLARFAPGAGPSSDALPEFATSEGTVVGTVPYLAPEQAAGLGADARADLFSLGVLLYELASGALPFHGATPVERLRSVLRDTPTPLAAVAPHVPARFADLVDRLLEKEPDRRPPTARAVEQELDSIGRGISEAETSADLPRQLAPPPARPAPPAGPEPAAAPRRRTLLRWLAPAVAAALLAAGGGVVARERRLRAEVDRLLDAGRAAEQLNDPQAARIAAGAFEQATLLRPRDATAWAEWSRALADAYEHDRLPDLLAQAESAAQRAYALGPDSTDALLARARMQRLRGRTDDAIATLEAIPKEGAAREVRERELADAWEQKGDAARAESHLLAAVAAGPSSWLNWNALGRFRAGRGNKPGARAAFERARELAPAGVSVPQENLAATLYLEGDIDGAIAAYEKIRSPVASPDSASNLGTLYYFKGRFADAERQYRQAIEIAPRQAIFRRNLADTLLRLGRADDAKAEYAEALRLVELQLAQTPKDAELRLARALYLARAGRCPDALREAAALAGELAPNPMTDHALARPFALCGAPAEAMARLRAAVGAGYPAASLAGEDELAALRGDAEFDRLSGAAAAR